MQFPYKIIVITALALLLMATASATYADWMCTPGPVTNLTAKPSGPREITVSWGGASNGCPLEKCVIAWDDGHGGNGQADVYYYPYIFVHTGLTGGYNYTYTVWGVGLSTGGPGPGSSVKAKAYQFYEDFDQYPIGSHLVGAGDWLGYDVYRYAFDIYPISNMYNSLSIEGWAGARDGYRYTTVNPLNGIIWAKFKAVGFDPPNYTMWNLWIDDADNKNLARMYGTAASVRGRVGPYHIATQEYEIGYGYSWSTIKAKIDTAANTTEYFLNGESIGVLDMTPTGAGDTVGRVRVERTDNINAMGDHIALEEICVFTDDTPPGPVTNFTATTMDGEVFLSWTNPTDPDYVKTRIVVQKYWNPYYPTSGTVIYEGTGTNYSYFPEPGYFYYYGAFARDEADNWSSGAYDTTGVGCFTEGFFYTPEWESIIGKGGWYGSDPSDRLMTASGDDLLIRGGSGNSYATHTVGCGPTSGIIWVRAILEETDSYYSQNDIWAIRLRDSQGNSLGDWVGDNWRVKAVLGGSSSGYNYIYGWHDNLDIKIDTNANNSQFFLNGNSVATFSHGSAGDSVGFVTIEALNGGGWYNGIWIEDICVTGADVLPPGPVTNFDVTNNEDVNSLSWTNPTDPDFSHVVINQSTTGYPANPGSGQTIYTGGGTSYDHAGCKPNKTYYYSAWAVDTSNNFSTVAQDSVATPSVVLVDNTASGGTHDGLTWETAFLTVAAGINAASSGQDVWVAGSTTATYSENITLKAGVKLYGGFAGNETRRGQRDIILNETILDGNNNGSVVTAPSGITTAAVIDGFTIQHGNGTGTTYKNGGGIYCNSAYPTITNNKIIDNTVNGSGGGVYLYCFNNDAVISNNTIADNSAGSCGGGIRILGGSPSVTENDITGNDAGYGGGVFDESDYSLISENNITGNTATNYGGGICCLCDVQPTISENTISENLAPYGAGIYCGGDSWAIIQDNDITDNGDSNTYEGGAVYCTGSAPTIAENTISGNAANMGAGVFSIACSYGVTIYCNLIKQNTTLLEGGGILIFSGSSDIVNNTIVDNSAEEGAGMAFAFGGSTNTVANNIVAFNTGGGLYGNGYSSITLLHNDVYGNTRYNYCGITPGATNISVDPLFYFSDPYYHLTYNSPCKNAGDDSQVGAGWQDMDDQQRKNGVVDIGADEVW